MIDRVATGIYARLGPRYLDLGIVAFLAAVMALTVINVGVAILYIRGSLEVFAQVVGVGELCMIAGAAVWVPIVRHFLVPLRRWAAGHRTAADATAAWRCAVIDFSGIVIAVATIVAVASAPAEIYEPTVTHVSTGEAIAAACWITIAIACGTVVVYFLAEALLRPVVDEVARAVPLGAATGRGGVSLSTKLLVFTPVVSFYVGALATSTLRDSSGLWGRFLTGLGTALGLSLTISLLGTTLMRRSLLSPVDGLIEAARRVGAGDLTVLVPPRAEDELGALTHSFNRMVAELRQRSLELQASKARIVTAADAERRRVERDLHDGAQQHLALLGLKLDAARRAVFGDPAAAASLHDEMRGDLEQALRALRDLAHGIYPAALEHDGLPSALRDAAEQSAIRTDLDCDLDTRYPPEVEAAIYFCSLEALQNAAKHAGDGARATLRLRGDNDFVEFEIADDGAGFDTTHQHAGVGLQNMADRVGALGGVLQVTSSPGNGTTITGRVPSRLPAADSIASVHAAPPMRDPRSPRYGGGSPGFGAGIDSLSNDQAMRPIGRLAPRRADCKRGGL